MRSTKHLVKAIPFTILFMLMDIYLAVLSFSSVTCEEGWAHPAVVLRRAVSNSRDVKDV